MEGKNKEITQTQSTAKMAHSTLDGYYCEIKPEHHLSRNIVQARE